MGGARRVWGAVTGHGSVGIVVIMAGVVVAKGPMEFPMGLSRGVNAAFLGGAFLGGTVVGFALFTVAVHPMKLCVGSFFLVASLCRVNVRPWRQEVWLLEIPVGFLERRPVEPVVVRR
jgi:hypothetical protein